MSSTKCCLDGWVWYRMLTVRRFIGDSHDGQIDVCAPPGFYGNLIVNVTRGQSRPNVPVGSTPTDTIGQRSRARLSPRYVLVVLKWRKNRSIFKARRVFSFDIVQSDSFLCKPANENNREAFAYESDHSRRLSWTCPWPSKICSSCEWHQFIRFQTWRQKGWFLFFFFFFFFVELQSIAKKWKKNIEINFQYWK